MRKIIYATAVFSALLLSGCVMYSDKDEEENPQLDVSDMMYVRYVAPLFRTAELADFFDRYQAVRDDREQSEALGAGCFGEYFISGNLHYEEFSAYPMWGKISLTDTPGEYVCIPAGTGLWDDIDAEYSVKALGGRRYSISCDASDDTDKDWKSLSVDAVIDCSSAVFSVTESLYVEYEEDIAEDKVTVVMTSPGSGLSVPLCSNGQVSLYPSDGVLHFEISGDVVDSFDAGYRDGNPEIMD